MSSISMSNTSTRTIRPRVIASAIAALVIAAGAHGGTATIESGDGGTATFEYEGTMLRINTEEPNTYIIVREGTMYVVNIEDGQPMVFNASSMMRGMASTAAKFAQNDAVSNFKSLEKTGRTETLAGIRGDVYLLTFTDDRGREQQEEAVLSKSPLARELRDALFAMTAVAGEVGGEEARAGTEEMQGQLDDLDAGVLRFGEDMRVTAISGDPIDASRFELPAEPMDMRGLGSMLGAAMSSQPAEDEATAGDNQQGGLLGGVLGAFGKKQSDEEGSAEDAAAEEAEEKKNPLKSLGKLFGKKKDN